MNLDNLFIAINSLDIVEPMLGLVFDLKHSIKGTRSPRGNTRALSATRIRIARGEGHKAGAAALDTLKSFGISASGRQTRKTYWGFLVPTSQERFARYVLSNHGYTVVGDEHNPGHSAPPLHKWSER